MEISERDKREAFASELADIFHRQEAIVQCNEFLSLTSSDRVEEKFRQMATEDLKILKMIENVINAFGLRMPVREGAMAMTDFILEQLQEETISPIEQLTFYTLMKQNQMLCCHLVHKSAQIAENDIKLALVPLEDVYALISKQVGTLAAYTEDFAVKWMTGEKPQSGFIGRARDAFATVAHAVSAKSAKPSEEKSVVKVLAAEHRKVEALFQEIKSCDTLAKAKDLFVQLKADLTAHSVAEEDTVYGYFLNIPEMRDKMVHAQREHVQLRNLLDETSYVSGKEDYFFEKIDELQEIVEHHVREEESEVFALMEKNAKEAELIQLSKRFLEEKRNIQINIGNEPVVASLANVVPESRV